MSYWTHIVGVLHVDTYHECDDIAEYVRGFLKSAPKITGSESDADVFVNAEPGYCLFISCDCGRCQYGNTIQHYEDGFDCDRPDGFRCPRGEYQTRAIITVCGDLRDRMKAQTRKEWNAFHNYLVKECDFDIRIATCRIDGY